MIFRCTTCQRSGDADSFILDGVCFCVGCGTRFPRLEGKDEPSSDALDRFHIAQARIVLEQCAHYLEGAGNFPSLAAHARRAAIELPSEGL